MFWIALGIAFAGFAISEGLALAGKYIGEGCSEYARQWRWVQDRRDGLK